MLSIRLSATGALLVVVVTATACSQSPVTQGTAAAPSTTSSAGTATATATVAGAPATTGAPRSTVVVTAPAQQRTVTRVVQPPGRTPQYTPSDSSSLRALYDDSSSVDVDDYYDEASGELFFDSPSENIGCYVTDGDNATCSIHHYDFPQPGPDCDRGIAATIDSSGYPSLTDCSGYFPVSNRGLVLQYGESITYGDIGCVSEPSGVSCLNLSTNTGFSLAREAYSPVS